MAQTRGEGTGRRRMVRGIVTSARMQKTIVVTVSRRVLHPVFEKHLKRATVVKAHDERGEAREGDEVEVEETRPLSRTKRWRLARIVRRGPVGGEAPGALSVEAESQARRAARRAALREKARATETAAPAEGGEGA